jgi:hypothetical protein
MQKLILTTAIIATGLPAGYVRGVLQFPQRRTKGTFRSALHTVGMNP